jgi:hypothetical protein
MSRNFWSEDRGYHVARVAFVRKQARDRVEVPGAAYDQRAIG